jgi:hypothetical protein
VRLSDFEREEREKKINWKDVRQRLKYSQILSQELEKNKSDLLKKKISVDVAKANVTSLNACIKKAVTGTIHHFYGKKRVKRIKHVKKRSWWNGTLGRLRKTRAKISRTILEASKTLIREIKLGLNVNKNNLTNLKKLFLIKILLNKRYKKTIKVSKALAAQAKRKKLIENFLNDNDLFWNQITHSRGSRVDIDIDVDILRQ